MSLPKTIVYSCITRGYDSILDVSNRGERDQIDFVMFHPKLRGNCKGWNCIPLRINHRLQGEIHQARFHKCLGPLLFPDHDILIWMDGNVSPNVNLEIVVQEFLSAGFDWAAFKHPAFRNVSAEITRLRKVGKITPRDFSLVEHQILAMDNWKPVDNVFATRFILRKNSAEMRAAMKSWWAALCLYSHRDQLTIDWILSQHDLVLADLTNFRSIRYDDLQLKAHKNLMRTMRDLFNRMFYV